MSGHIFLKHEACPSPASCVYCKGVINLCTVCGGASGANNRSLPKVCPARRMTAHERALVEVGLQKD